MSSFTTPLTVELGDGKMWRLAKSFKYHVGSEYSKKVIQVPVGFETDFASVPKFFWFFPYWSKYNKSPVLHDFCYQRKIGTRKQADLLFYESMVVTFRDYGLRGRIIAWTFYTAVRLFGWMAWK